MGNTQLTTSRPPAGYYWYVDNLSEQEGIVELLYDGREYDPVVMYPGSSKHEYLSDVRKNEGLVLTEYLGKCRAHKTS
jgi:hypothetical protein